MSILVFGHSGQVATELRQHDGVVALGRDRVDVADPLACEAAIRSHAPRAVINAAAYTAVDKAESEEPLAERINGAAPGVMARTCADLGIPLVHISTDYVFDGQGTDAWRPQDPIAPQNAYGRTKAKGEAQVREAGGRHAILRTSWVFSAHGANFVKTMLRLSEGRDHLNVVADQMGGPTPARAIADACLTMADQLCDDAQKSGTYHFCGAPEVSWHGFATQIFELAGRKVDVSPIPTSEFPTPASRPLNSRMDCSATLAAFGIAQPDWRTALIDVLNELEATP